MRTIAISIIAIMMMASFIDAADPECDNHWKSRHNEYRINHDLHNYHWNDGIRFVIDDGDVIISCEKRRYKSDEVKITEDYRLYVNGDRVNVDDDQKELLKDYYHKAIDLHEEAEIVAREGAKIGAEGAKIGTKAAAGALKMLFLDFNEDEFEAKIEKEAEELEEMAEELEARAEVLEDMAEDLEDMHNDLARKIPELRELQWF
ncbi:MAG: hypothetical protein JSU85_14645 [Candidatus Zixiibacteriota bacterium]|nr:MAG: hypothetical protein JSU85_14645 [candidate division Zixibacteria bacterium]